MPRDSNGVWTDIPNIEAVPGQTIESADWNGYRADLRDNEFNVPRPIEQGGTGASTAEQARINLGIPLNTPATTAEFLANVPDKFLDTDGVNAAGAILALTDAATVSWNMALGINASVTLGGNRALALPTNMIIGRSGFLRIKQDATGSRSLTLASGWKGGPITLSTAANTEDYLFYVVIATNQVLVTGVKRAVGP
jgi:hypothetical protein